MQAKPAVRSLAALSGASSARVLNLLTVRRVHGRSEDYRTHPFFDSPVLNSAIVLKHRLRSDDQYLFNEPNTTATKIVLPLDRGDLRLGGTSFFFRQKGFLDIMREAGRYSSVKMDRDLRTLEILDSLPSLDPFLVHERFALEGVQVADCYFEISAADKQHMHDFVSREIGALIALACGGDNASVAQSDASAARLSSAILANGAETQLEPLRRSLLLEEHEFRGGIFSWRGFLYYKWRYLDLLPKVKQVLREIVELPLERSERFDDLEMAKASRKRLVRQIATISGSITESIRLYDGKYRSLVKDNDAPTFRQFLLSAPRLFVDLGEKFGGIAHVESFWRYRFPRPQNKPMRADEAQPMFADFLVGMGASPTDFEVAA